MLYYSGLIAAALAAVAGAVQFNIPPSGYAPVEGQPIDLSYSGADGPVTITLKNGPIGNLQTVEVIGSGPAGEGTVTWIPEGLPSDTYAFEIMVTGGSAVNYSPQFSYQGTGPAVTNDQTTNGAATDTALTGTDTTATPATAVTPTDATADTTTDTTNGPTSPTNDATTTTDDAATTTEPLNQNDDNGTSRLGSSMALVLGAAALLITFN